METYEQLQLSGLPETASETSRSCRQGYPVNLTALQEKVSAIVTAATWSKSLSELSEKFAQNGSSLKIRPVYSQGKISDTLIELSTTYPRWGMVLPGGCGELVTSEPRNSESEYSSFVETYATPTASDSIRVSFSNISLIKACANRGKTSNLTEQIICKDLFPTPVASGKLGGGTGGYNKLRSMLARSVISKEEFKSMTAGDGGKLNPEWVEWLQGFPIGWTDCDVSGTQ